jgi:hypothetical protein
MFPLINYLRRIWVRRENPTERNKERFLRVPTYQKFPVSSDFGRLDLAGKNPQYFLYLQLLVISFGVLTQGGNRIENR